MAQWIFNRIRDSYRIDPLSGRIVELEQRLARVAELAHDRDGDTHEQRSLRLGQCAGIAWDHMEEAFSDDPLKKESTLKWAHLAKQLTISESKRVQVTEALNRIPELFSLAIFVRSGLTLEQAAVALQASRRALEDAEDRRWHL